MCFNNFCKSLLPFSKEFADIVTLRPEFYLKRECNTHKYFTLDTRNNLKSLLQLMFKSETGLIKLKSKFTMDLRIAFALLDTDKDEFVNAVDLRDFFAKYGFYATEREITGLMLRFSKTCIFNYEQFKQVF